MNPSKFHRPIQFVTLGVLLLLCKTAVKSSGPQMIIVGCSRRVIESYPEAQSKPVLRLLDESRSLTDDFMRVFSKGDLGEIHRRYPQLDVWFNKDAQGGALLELPEVFPTIGAPIRFEYRSDEALYSLSRLQIEPRGSFSTLYWLGTNKTGGDRADEHLYVVVETRMVNAERRVTSVVLFGDWTDKRFSEERLGTKCSGMESGLRMRT